MQFYRITSHTRYDIKLHFVWITKYRRPILTEEVAVRVRELVRELGVSLAETARAVGVSTSAVSKIQADERVIQLSQLRPLLT